MGTVSIQTIETNIELIRELIHKQNKTDYEIMTQLNLSAPRYYRYKATIQKEDQEVWDLVHQDSTKFRAVQLLQDLDKCRSECLKMSEDKTLSPKDRRDSLVTACEASANIFKMLHEGLGFNTSIPKDKITQIIGTSNVQVGTIEDNSKCPDSDIKAPATVSMGNEPWPVDRPKNSKDSKTRVRRDYFKTPLPKYEEEDNTLQLD